MNAKEAVAAVFTVGLMYSFNFILTAFRSFLAVGLCP